MKVLVVVDMQHDFVDGALGSPAAQAIVPQVAAKIRAYQEAGDYIICTRDTHRENYPQTQEGKNLPIPHCIRGTQGWQILEQLECEDLPKVDKGTFGSRELPQVLAQAFPNGDMDSIELVGLCTDICVISNAMVLKAFFPEVPILVDSACCAGVTPQSHENALEAMKVCQIAVL